MKDLVNFFFEIETLKNIKRSGSFIARVDHPDSIAEHIAIAAQIAFFLAKKENVPAEKCACILLFHDNPEVRIGDLNKINKRYLDSTQAEKKAQQDQIQKLPPEIQVDLQQYFLEYSEQKTKVAQVCWDADLLECAFQAKIFLEQGYQAKKSWLDAIEKNLKTKSGQNIFKELKNTPSNDWWKNLKKYK